MTEEGQSPTGGDLCVVLLMRSTLRHQRRPFDDDRWRMELEWIQALA